MPSEYYWAHVWPRHWDSSGGRILRCTAINIDVFRTAYILIHTGVVPSFLSYCITAVSTYLNTLIILLKTAAIILPLKGNLYFISRKCEIRVWCVCVCVVPLLPYVSVHIVRLPNRVSYFCTNICVLHTHIFYNLVQYLFFCILTY